MTKLDDAYIALAVLHGPSTVHDIEPDIPSFKDRGNHDPLHRNRTNHLWWVFRNGICAQEFNTAGEAARFYCRHYGLSLSPEVINEATAHDETTSDAVPPGETTQAPVGAIRR